MTIHESAPFGTVLGYAPGGVPIYSSDYDTLEDKSALEQHDFEHYVLHEYMGYKWQCVEFARRFLFLNYGTVFTDVRMAYDIFQLRFLRHVVDDNILPLQAYENGSQKAPQPGALLIWASGGEYKYTGHVAIITEVFPDKVRIVEQNVIHHLLPTGQQWTRELPLTYKDGQYFLQDTFTDTHILGWMIQTSDTQYALPIPQINPDLLALHSKTLTNHQQYDNDAWLDKNTPLEKVYMLANHGAVINQNPYHYLTLSKTANQLLMHASNELHLMYLHATEKVLKEPQLLEKFNIPRILWPRLRLSWKQRRHSMISGRLDFCMDERGLKVYEYNADSASCHTEAGEILEKWAQQSPDVQGGNPADSLLDALADAWRNSDALKFIHILQDNDAEEDYHALFMQQAMAKAGIESKILRGLDQLQWNRNGKLIDNDVHEVRCVWKTWAWETAFEQLRSESEEALSAPPIATGSPQRKVRLIDVLLRPEVRVFEPLWTAIPSNKAILPVLWELFPNHRYLLDADFAPSDALKTTGYAVKPIAGRCGNNIDLVNHHNGLLDTTSGQFSEQNAIYQQLWCLPKIENRYVQLCTFTCGGHFGGTCVRSDPSLVIRKESDIDPLRVEKDADFLKK